MTKKILIVDDEPRAREGLKRTLEQWAEGKAEITCLDNAHATMQFLKNERIHLLITDIRMPEMSGLKLLEALRQQHLQPMVIVISAYSEFEYAQEALRLGVINYLLKPIGKTKLIEAVEEALSKQEEQAKAGMIRQIVDQKLIDIKVDESFSRSIKQAMTYIDDHYSEDLSLKKVAAHVHLNPSYLSTLFREELSISFTEYISRVRIQHAKQLLLTSDLNISEIAEKVGYQTPKYFNKLFKEQENMTPNAFRKENESAF